MHRVYQRADAFDVTAQRNRTDVSAHRVRLHGARRHYIIIIFPKCSLKEMRHCVVHHGVEAPVVASEVVCAQVTATSIVTLIFATWLRKLFDCGGRAIWPYNRISLISKENGALAKIATDIGNCTAKCSRGPLVPSVFPEAGGLFQDTTSQVARSSLTQFATVNSLEHFGDERRGSVYGSGHGCQNIFAIQATTRCLCASRTSAPRRCPG